MRNPLQVAADAFLRCNPSTLLVGSIFVSVLEFVAFLYAARIEGVVHIGGGVGFLSNYGLLSTLIGNAVLPYLARLYFEYVSSFRESRALRQVTIVERELSLLRSMLRLQGRYRYVLYFLIFIGSAFWISNTSIHVLGNVEAYWGHKVFDSLEHPISFVLNRLNNVVTWMLVLPFCGYVIVFCTIQLARAVKGAEERKEVAYDLLNPDGCGGFRSIENAHVVLNVVTAIVYVQITLHTGTFGRMNAEHIIAYVAATLILLFGNTLFLGNIHHRISRLRTEALNDQKDKVYKNDSLSFEVLKFFYQTQTNRFSMINVATKAIALFAPILIKAAPSILEVIRPMVVL